ncbi:MAG: HEAT repeat domain-containing protein, partial [Planctomycetaceae bacterium]|nr:HEAT repeat domain-containing protein [Planctomycetaceae bacterium]
VVKEDGRWEFIPLDPSVKPGGVPTEYPVGFFTSATGITIYRGDAYPAEYQSNAFVGDVGGNLIHRKLVDTDKVVYRAERADAGEEIVASSDNWFRPVNFVNAPDGTLYVLDMYRETIEHPYSIPEEIKKFLYLTSGHDRGRIYRLVSPNTQRHKVKPLADLPLPKLVAELGSGNAWNRETAQRLLWERQDTAAVPLAESFLTTTDSVLGRLHAAYTLDGLNALKPSHVEQLLQDSEPRLRAHGIRLAERFADRPGNLSDLLLKLTADPNDHVRFQLAFSLGEFHGEQAVAGLTELAKQPDNSAEVRTAVLSSVADTADRLAIALLKQPDAASRKHLSSMISELAVMIGTQPTAQQTLRLLTAVTEPDVAANLQRLVLVGIGTGLARRGTSLKAVLADGSAADVRSRVRTLFVRAAEQAGNGDVSLPERRSALQLLSLNDTPENAEFLADFLTPRTPQPLQQAAVEALGAAESDSVADLILSAWTAYSPQTRRDVTDSLLSHPKRLLALLKAVEQGTVKRSDLERTVKQQLLSHRDAGIRQRCEKLFGDDVLSSRAKVVADYQPALELTGNAENGRKTFVRICSACHKVGDVGHLVAPELASVRNKSEADLLIAILDPNREAQPNFNTYTVVTSQGRSFSGIIAVETPNSLTLRRAEAKEDVVLRSNIEELISNGISLMPEGLEKDLGVQDIADVIAFVKSITATAAGN